MTKAYRVGAGVFSGILTFLLFAYLSLENRSTTLVMFSYEKEGLPVALLKASVLVFAYGLALSAYLTVRKCEQVWIAPAIIHAGFLLALFGVFTHAMPGFQVSDQVALILNTLTWALLATVDVIVLLMIVQTARGLYDPPERDDNAYDWDEEDERGEDEAVVENGEGRAQDDDKPTSLLASQSRDDEQGSALEGMWDAERS